MKKLLLLTQILFSAIACNAQQWCLPGAVWNYTFSSSGINNTYGYSEIRYQGDTMIAGKNCNRLLYSRFASQFTPVFPAPQPQYKFLYTYANNGVVQLRTGPTSFDTLFNVNAQPGMVWRFQRYGMTCGTFTANKVCATVIDTGHIMINSANVRYTDVLYDALPWPGGSVSASLTVLRFVDRVGCINDFFHAYIWNCPNQTDGWNSEGALTCYWDNEMPIYNTGKGVCNYNFLGLKDAQLDSDLKILPNPASAEVYLKSGNTDARFELRDYVGNLLLETGNGTLNLSNYPAGLYFVIEHNAGTATYHKLVHE
jgi:hypothetical protein